MPVISVTPALQMCVLKSANAAAASGHMIWSWPQVVLMLQHVHLCVDPSRGRVDEADLHKVTGDDQWEVQQVQGPDGDTHQGRMPQWIANIITNHNGQAGAAAASAAAASSAAVADGSTFPPSSGAAVVHQAASQAAPSAAMPAAHVPAGRPQAAAADFAAQQPDSPAVLDKRASGLISPPGAPQAAGKVPLAAAASLAGVSSLPVDAAGLVPALVAALNRTHIMPQQILPCAVGAATATRAHTAVEQQQQQQLLTLLQELLQQQLQQLAGCSTGQSSAAHSAAAATLVESMQLPPAPTAAVHAATTALPPQPAAPPGHSPAAAAAVGSSQHAGSQPQPQHAEQPPALAAATAAAPACSSSSSGSSQSRNKNRIPLLDLVVDEVTQYLTAHSGQGVPPHEVVTELLSTHNLVLFPYLFIWLSNKLRRMRVSRGALWQLARNSVSCGNVVTQQPWHAMPPAIAEHACVPGRKRSHQSLLTIPFAGGHKKHF